MKKDFNIAMGDDYPEVIYDDLIVLQSVKRLMDSKAFEIPFWRNQYLNLGLSRGQLISDYAVSHAKDVLSFEFTNKEPRAYVDSESLQITRFNYRDIQINIRFLIKDTKSWYEYTNDLSVK